MRRRTTTVPVAAAAAALLLAACGGSEDDSTTTDGGTPARGATAESGSGDSGSSEQGGDALATAEVQDADGSSLGVVTFADDDGGIRVTAELEGMDEGYYGFHLHTAGLCEADSAAPDDPADTGDFLSAGGHIGAGDSDHPDHPGDLPSLLVTADGAAHLEVVTDRVTEEDLLDDDGTAVMVHSGQDNFANVPDRYAPDGPDQDTLDTGDAGERLACGVVEGS